MGHCHWRRHPVSPRKGVVGKLIDLKLARSIRVVDFTVDHIGRGIGCCVIVVTPLVNVDVVVLGAPVPRGVCSCENW